MPLTPAKMAQDGALGIEFVSPPIAGAVVGHFADLYFKTDPWLTLAMFLLGVFAGFFRLIVVLRDLQRELR